MDRSRATICRCVRSPPSRANCQRGVRTRGDDPRRECVECDQCVECDKCHKQPTTDCREPSQHRNREREPGCVPPESATADPSGQRPVAASLATRRCVSCVSGTLRSGPHAPPDWEWALGAGCTERVAELTVGHRQLHAALEARLFRVQRREDGS